LSQAADIIISGAPSNGYCRETAVNYFTARPTFTTRPPPGPRQGAALNATDWSDDNARFKSVVLPNLDDAYGLARWLVGNRTDAEDVVQEACLRAFRGIANFSNGNARAWLLTIVRHTAYGWLHKNRPGLQVLVEDIEEVEDAHCSDLDVETPETVLVAKDDATLLEAAIAALPVPFRETLVLREVQSLSYREIAEVTGAPVGTVMSRLARARSRLLLAVSRSE
jgi:RNA polymerase sigma factor (sigma-70 family)